MCGILACFNRRGFRREDVARAVDALRAMRHRGPDGEGLVLLDTRTGSAQTLALPDAPPDLPYDCTLETYEPRSADLVLAHRRLSIFDLSSRGHQPMRDDAGNWIVFNGEIYNFWEIRDDLKSRGHAFKTRTDTEVILAAYRQWGSDCLKRFNGMWAFVLFDAAEKRLFIANDRVGIKQLYYVAQGDELILASEIKAVVTLTATPLTLHRENIDWYLEAGHLDFNLETFYQEIHRVPPAHFQQGRPETIAASSFQRYWDFPQSRRRFTSREEASAAFHALMDDAIGLRMRADVPWGINLSGGLDSSAIAYLAHKRRLQNGHPAALQSFTAVFPGMAGDESAYAEFVERDLGLQAHYVNPLDEFDWDDFEHFLTHQDLPVATPSCYASWCVMRLAHTTDVKVLLNGQGGDELFAGYHHHFYKYVRALWLRGRFLKSRRLITAYARLKGRDPMRIYQAVIADFKTYAKLKLKHRMPGPGEVFDASLWWTLDEIQRRDVQSRILPLLLRYEDRNSMAFGLEARLPFLDHRLIEFALALPASYKIHAGWQKFIVRAALDEVPDTIRFRKDKMGFTTPTKAWIERYRALFEARAQDALNEGFARLAGKHAFAERDHLALFRMACLGIWLETQKDARHRIPC